MSDGHSPAPVFATHIEVQIEVGNPTYTCLTDTIYGPETRSWWEALGDALHGRPGWRCGLVNGGRGELHVLWSYGGANSSLFNIGAPDDPSHYQSGWYRLFDYEADESQDFDALVGLAQWLDSNESRHADHLTQMRGVASINNWEVLARVGTQVRVSYDPLSMSFIATFPTLPMQATFAETLGQLLANARDAIVHAYGAPSAVAERLDLEVRLDPEAAQALTLRP